MADAKGKTHEAAAQAEGQAAKAGEKAKEVTVGVLGAVTEKVQDVAAGASELAVKAKERAQEWASAVGDTVEQAKDKAWEAASAASERVGDLGQEVTALIRRHPVPALLMGVGVGYLLGVTLSRRPPSSL